MHKEGDPGLAAGLNHALTRGVIRSHWFLTNDRNPIASSHVHQGFVGRDGGDNINKIRFFFLENSLGLSIGVWNMEKFCNGLGLGKIGVTDSYQIHLIFKFQPGRDLETG